MKIVLYFLLSVVIIPLSARAEKERCAGNACFPEKHAVGDTELALQGTALFEYWSFDVYTGALYSSAELKTSDQVLKGDAPIYLVLEYHRELTKQNIIDNSEHILLQNPEINLSELRPTLDKLYASYSDVKDGDRYGLLYLPGVGTKLFFNGKLVFETAGEDFFKAYFGIWLSRYSVKNEFTKKLLAAP